MKNRALPLLTKEDIKSTTIFTAATFAICSLAGGIPTGLIAGAADCAFNLAACAGINLWANKTHRKWEYSLHNITDARKI